MQESQTHESSQAALSRRELLKVLAASGGALAAAAFLPGKWSKPLVQAGVLPAHAQATPEPEPPSCPYDLLQSAVGGIWPNYIADVAWTPAAPAAPMIHVNVGNVLATATADFSLNPPGNYTLAVITIVAPGGSTPTDSIEIFLDFGNDCVVSVVLDAPIPPPP